MRNQILDLPRAIYQGPESKSAPQIVLIVRDTSDERRLAPRLNKQPRPSGVTTPSSITQRRRSYETTYRSSWLVDSRVAYRLGACTNRRDPRVRYGVQRQCAYSFGRDILQEWRTADCVESSGATGACGSPRSLWACERGSSQFRKDSHALTGRERKHRLNLFEW